MSESARLTASALAAQWVDRGLAGRGLTARQTNFIRSLWMREHPGLPATTCAGAGITGDGRVFSYEITRPTGGSRYTNLSSVFVVTMSCDACDAPHRVGLRCNSARIR